MNGVWCLIVLVENQHRSAYFGIIQITIRLQTFESVFLNKDGKSIGSLALLSFTVYFS